MKSILCCVLGVVLSVSTAWSQAGKTGEQAVAALEQQWLQSQKTNNPDLLAPLLAEKFVDITSDGKVIGKAETLALVKSMKLDSAEYTDVKVTLFGDTAIATGGFQGKGSDGSGKSLEIDERWTDTWVKMSNGKWQCVASQATPVKM